MSPAQSPTWAIAIHGGAGAMSRDRLEGREEEYLEALAAPLREGMKALSEGGASLDIVESVVRLLEDDPRFNAGRGAVYNREAAHELDAAIMSGRDLRCGAVGGVRSIKNPVSLARQVMERTSHVLLIGDGAEAFAEAVGAEQVPPEYFHTRERWDELQRALVADGEPEIELGTVGAVAMDQDGDLAAATSTGGITSKLFGRVGDTPIIGAGTYADNRTCAVSGTGKGEHFIRHAVAYSVSARMALAGRSLEEAADDVVHGTLQPGDGGVVAVDRRGRIALVHNSRGMFRGAADAGGRFEVAIW